MVQCPHCQKEVAGSVIYCPHCEANLTKDVYERSFTTGGVWGGVLLFIVLFILIFKISTSGQSLYDRGYDDGAEEVKSEFLYLISKKYKEGHADGLHVAWYFEKGCEDKANRMLPQYQEVDKYMEGYKFC